MITYQETLSTIQNDSTIVSLIERADFTVKEFLNVCLQAYNDETWLPIDYDEETSELWLSVLRTKVGSLLFMAPAEAEDEPQDTVDESQDTLLATIKEALVRWNLNDFPEYDKLVAALYRHAVDRPEDTDLKAVEFIGAITWELSSVSTCFWIDADKWSTKK